MVGVPRHRRSSWIGKAVALLIAGVVFTCLVVILDRVSRPAPTEEQRIRGAVGAFLDACRERDYRAVWELQSRETRRLIAAQRADIGGAGRDDEEFFVAHAGSRGPSGRPAAPVEWFPWALPPEDLSALAITSIERNPRSKDVDALVELRPVTGARNLRWEFILAEEEARWRIGALSLYVTDELPARSAPLPEVRGTLEDGRSVLTLGVGEANAPGPPDRARVLVLRIDRRATFGRVAPLLHQACDAGFEEIRIRAERRERATRVTWVLFNGLKATPVTTGGGDPEEIVYPIPRRPADVDLVIGVGNRARPDWADEDVPFRTALSVEATRALERFTDLLGHPLGRLAVIVSAHPTTEIDRLANVWSDLARLGCRPPILATENPVGAGYASPLLINGLRPEQVLRTTVETLPRVWPDNPVLQRTVARSR